MKIQRRLIRDPYPELTAKMRKNMRVLGQATARSQVEVMTGALVVPLILCCNKPPPGCSWCWYCLQRVPAPKGQQ